MPKWDPFRRSLRSFTICLLLNAHLIPILQLNCPDEEELELVIKVIGAFTWEDFNCSIGNLLFMSHGSIYCPRLTVAKLSYILKFDRGQAAVRAAALKTFKLLKNQRKHARQHIWWNLST